MRDKIIVGTAAIGRLNTAPAIKGFVAKCVSAGFTSFDTAPLYGSGIMEGLLAKALEKANPRQEISVNTKFGLYAPHALTFLDGAYLLKKSAMALVKRMPGTISCGKSRASLLETARESLDRSVRQFGKGRIDVFFAHEIPIELLMTAPMLDFIRESKRSGCFERFGLGGYRSQYSGGGNKEFWDCVDVIQVESKPGHPVPLPAEWNGSVFLHGVISRMKADPPQTAGANPVRSLLREAFEIQRADHIVVGISRESHLTALVDGLKNSETN